MVCNLEKIKILQGLKLGGKGGGKDLGGMSLLTGYSGESFTSGLLSGEQLSREGLSGEQLSSLLSDQLSGEGLTGELMSQWEIVLSCERLSGE